MAQEENIVFKRIKQFVRNHRLLKRRRQPQAEEDLGGGDICSLQEQPSTDDDQPLDGHQRAAVAAHAWVEPDDDGRRRRGDIP